jgi:arylsulfatase A-like enzyme
MLPSHASLFTGRWPHELSANQEDRPLDGTFPTVAEYLRDHVYISSGIVANTYFCNSWFGLGRGFVHYDDCYAAVLRVTFAEILRCSELGRRALRCGGAAANQRPEADHPRKDAARINRDALDWLDPQSPDHRFFLFLNYFDAYDPYLVPDGWNRRFGHTPNSAEQETLRRWLAVKKQTVSFHDAGLVRDAYDDCLSYLDEELGMLFDELWRRGLWDNTIVILTADHGEVFGEHEFYGHGKTLYREEIEVPLLIAHARGATPGLVVSEPVSLRDVAATSVDEVGLGAAAPFPGRSLARLCRSRPTPAATPDHPILSEVLLRKRISPSRSRLRAPASRGPMHALAAGDLVYIRHGVRTEELYNVRTNPHELHDLSRMTEYGAVVERFRTDLGLLTTP